MKILLVDDDADDRTFFSEAIRQIDSDITCEVARDGQEALTKLSVVAPLPDAIFLDVNMPIVNGKECFEKIKSNKKLRNIPVVMFSTSSEPVEIDRFQSQGAAYVTKPSTFPMWVDILRKYIDNIKGAMFFMKRLT